MQKTSSLDATLVFFLLLMLTVAAYWPGLSGGFLFDDQPNLSDLGLYGGVTDWETFKSFVFNGFSGPTGRPLSLLSFLLNDNTWPSQAAWFKPTNLMIHLLVGLLVCWSTLLLLRLYGLTEQRALWMAVLSSGIWLLHPYFVSTTLYVVQRMAQLATLFMLAGLIGYLHGRLLLSVRPRAAYLWMSLSLTLGTLLAVLSKENGALLPLLVMVVEFCAPTTTLKPPCRWWRAVFLWLPSLAVLGVLAKQIDFSDDLWPSRSFNQPQRLMSEGRILWEYLFHLYVPRIEGRGLFQDGYAISTGWFAPATTALAAFALATLAVAAVLFRKRWPLFALAVLFFMAAHLMESTVLGLELYFEHRNYAAAVFLFLPMAAAIVYLATRVRPFVLVIVAGLLFLVLAWMTWQRASLWADTGKLELYWAISTPASPRAQNAVANVMLQDGQFDEANRFLELASERLPDSALLSIRLLLQKVYLRQADAKDFARAAERLKVQPFDAQAMLGVRTLVDQVIEPSRPADYRRMTLDVLAAMAGNDNYRRFPLFQRLIPYLNARVLLAQGKADAAYAQYTQAMTLYSETDASLMMVSEMAITGHPELALRLLGQAKLIFRDQPDKSLRRSRALYTAEIVDLEKTLLLDVANKRSP